MSVCVHERERERAHHCNQGLLQQLSAMSTGEGHCRRRCGGCVGVGGRGRVGSAAVQVKGNSKARTLKKADFMPFDILMPSLRFSLSSCSTCSFSLFFPSRLFFAPKAKTLEPLDARGLRKVVEHGEFRFQSTVT